MTARKPGQIAKRNGRPSYEAPPPRAMAPVPMRDWLARSQKRESRMKKFVLAALALLTAACSATPTPKPAILTAKEQAALDCIGHGGTWQIAYPGPVYTCTPSALPPVPVVSK